jgi:hypothetical protein
MFRPDCSTCRLPVAIYDRYENFAHGNPGTARTVMPQDLDAYFILFIFSVISLQDLELVICYLVSSVVCDPGKFENLPAVTTLVRL